MELWQQGQHMHVSQSRGPPVSEPATDTKMPAFPALRFVHHSVSHLQLSPKQGGDSTRCKYCTNFHWAMPLKWEMSSFSKCNSHQPQIDLWISGVPWSFFLVPVPYSRLAISLVPANATREYVIPLWKS